MKPTYIRKIFFPSLSSLSSSLKGAILTPNLFLESRFIGFRGESSRKRSLLPVFLGLFLGVFLALPALVSQEVADPNKFPLKVEWFGQRENPWGEQTIGTGKGTLADYGCLLTSISMVLNYYGSSLTPESLNRFLTKNNGYLEAFDDTTGESMGKILPIWDKVIQSSDQIQSLKRASYRSIPANIPQIKEYLDQGIPVLAETRRPGGIYHFVVLTGYTSGEEVDFLIEDPWIKTSTRLSQIYNLCDEYGCGATRNIYGIRVLMPEENSN